MIHDRKFESSPNTVSTVTYIQLVQNQKKILEAGI